MKKKYIIALEDRNVWSCGLPAKTLLLSDVSIFGTDLASVNTGIELTPYTEPNLDKVREEAYLKGLNDGQGVIFESTQNNAFNNGYKKCLEDMEQVKKEIYQQGLSDMLETVKELFRFSFDEQAAIFKTTSVRDIVRGYSASEVIEKIRQYEQEKEEEKKEQSFTAEDVMRQYLDTFCKGRCCAECPLHIHDFTCVRGRHFLYDTMSNEEVRKAYSTVLAKMKE